MFPAGIGEVWDDTRRGRVDRVDDDAFARALVPELTDEKTASTRPVFVIGLSIGGFFAERLTRRGILTPRGLVPVVSTTRQATRWTTPRPRAGTAVLCFAGTADRWSRAAGAGRRVSRGGSRAGE